MSRIDRCGSTCRLSCLLFSVLVCVGVSIRSVPWVFPQAKSVEGAAAAFPRIQRTELLNGLRVRVIERPGTVAVINLLVKAGSFAEARDKAGLANLTAQSVCFANAKLPLQRWKDELEFLGARIEIRVTTDSTVFQAHVPSSNAEPVLALLSRLVVRPEFESDSVDRIRSQPGSSRVAGSEDHAIARLQLAELVFGRTGCGREEWATQHSMDALRLADVEAFHKAHYLPNNTALIVVGGPPMDRLGDFVREKFGGWIKSELQPIEPTVIPMPARSVIRIVDRTASDALLLFGHSAPARQTPDFFGLNLANNLLVGLGKNSRLEQAFAKTNIPHQALRSDLELKQACGWFYISVRAPLSAVPAAVTAILEGIEDIKTRPVSESELSQAKAVLISSYQATLETETGLAEQVTAIELFDLARDFLASFPLRVEQVSAERVQEAAKNYLSSTQISGVIMGDRKTLTAGLADFRSFEILEPEGTGSEAR